MNPPRISSPERLALNHETAHDPFVIKEQYDDFGLNVKLRWKAYDYARESFDFIEDVYKKSGIQPTDSLLDIGCNDGVEMYHIKNAGHHIGRLAGLDINLMPLDLADKRQKIHNQPMNFVRGSADDLPFKANSFDAAMSLFTLYHANHPAKSLGEIQRVVKKDGRVILSTSGRQNKQKHRAFEADIAEQLDIDRPGIFAKSFISEQAGKLIGKYFTIVEQVNHKTEMVITKDSIRDYYNSLWSMRSAFNPIPNTQDYYQQLAVIEQKIKSEIDASPNGEFIDSIDRTYYIVRNDQKK